MPKDESLAVKLDKADLDTAASDDIVESDIEYHTLTKVERLILSAEVKDFMSESSRTVEAISKEIGVSMSSIFRAHKNQRYTSVFDRVTDRIFQTMAHVGYSGLLKAARDGKVSASKLILEVTNKYTPKVQTESVNVNVNIGDDRMTPDAAIERFLVLLGTRGWSLEMIAEVWHRLKASQAF